MGNSRSGRTLGVLGSSAKENEHRLPLHPEHLARIPDELRALVTLEEGYGERFGWSDDELAGIVGAISGREQVLSGSDIVILPKPQHADLELMREGQVLWGWPHFVQDTTMTQLAIDRKLTAIAFEVMNHWKADGSLGMHVFARNNELAGYCSVLHAFALTGTTGAYGRRRRAVVIGSGATARGAITALETQGVREVSVLTNRPVVSVSFSGLLVDVAQLDTPAGSSYGSQVIASTGRVPLAGFLTAADIVVNCTLQDPEAPLMFLSNDDLAGFRRGSLVVDVSCDEGMGFEWAQPTTFDEPMFEVGGVDYYAVDHSPSYLWDAATWENSEALLPFLPVVMGGPELWEADETITRATEIRDGRVLNPAILRFQGREAEPPHAFS